MFSSRSFSVSGLMFKSLIHFELILIHFVTDFLWQGQIRDCRASYEG